VQVVQGVKHLTCNVANNIKGNAPIPEVLYERKQVVTQHLEHHAHVAAMGTHMSKSVQKPTAAVLIIQIAISNFCEDLYFISGCLGVVRGRLLDFEGSKAISVTIVNKPHGRKMAPSKLAQHTVAAIAKFVPYANWVVTPCSVILISNNPTSDVQSGNLQY
jgi:hypothetical protein